MDYGSQADCTERVKQVCENYSFLRYFFTNTRGKLWCKSEVLNYLTQQSVGEYVFILDSDVYMEDGFLHLLYQELQRISCPLVLELRFWETLPNGIRKKLRTSRGLYVAQKTHLVQKGGYDTFFKTWGVEDEEIIRRLAGKQENPVFVSEEARLIHIWHAFELDKRPKGWVDFLTYQYLPEKQQRNFLPTENYFNPLPTLLAYENRPALQKRDSGDYENVRKFVFKFPFLFCQNQFIATFSQLQEGEFLCIEQTFSYYQTDNQTFMKRIINLCNKLLSKIGFSYRLVDVATADTELITLLQVRDFLFYFIIHFEAQILDYFFEYNEQKITFWVCKKSSIKTRIKD
jgi:hypothetical protein